MEVNRSKDVVTTFLSCSVRPKDWPLVDALVERVLVPRGFRCFTIGRNVSLADQTDDAISSAHDDMRMSDRHRHRTIERHGSRLPIPDPERRNAIPAPGNVDGI